VRVYRVEDTIYQCPVCHLYFKLRFGKLTPPTGLIHPPEYINTTPQLNQNNFDIFLREKFNMTRSQYNSMDDNSKKKVRIAFLNWLKQRKRRIQKQEEVSTKEELFAWFLKNVAKINLWAYEDLDERMKKELRQAFYKWAEENGYI